jgi:hypothetical protein
MQIILGIMPLAIRARYNNLVAWLRINNSQTTPPPGVVLPPHLQDIYDDFVQTGLAHCSLDAIPKTPSHATLNVDISDGIEKEHHYTDISIYTDRSKINEPDQWGTGAGYVIMSKNVVLVNSHVTLCHTKTVFQSEIIAIQLSLKAFLKHVCCDPVATSLEVGGSPKDSRAKPICQLTPIKRRFLHQPNKVKTHKPFLFPNAPLDK